MTIIKSKNNTQNDMLVRYAFMGTLVMVNIINFELFYEHAIIDKMVEGSNTAVLSSSVFHGIYYISWRSRSRNNEMVYLPVKYRI